MSNQTVTQRVLEYWTISEWMRLSSNARIELREAYGKTIRANLLVQVALLHLAK